MIKEAQKENLTLLEWESATKLAFKQLKKALLQAPTLNLPTSQYFNLYVIERGGMVLGICITISEIPE